MPTKGYSRQLSSEQTTLAELYAPLMARLAASSGTLHKLGFSVRRVVDSHQWGGFAEENLLDRRKVGPFNGRGSFDRSRGKAAETGIGEWQCR